MIIFPQCLIRLPCRMWNVDKWTPEEYESRMADAEAMFDCSLDLCEDQHARGRGCVLEHPTPASSWKRDKARRVMAIPGFRRTNFDQCATGLVSPSNEPMKKRTSLLSNMVSIHGLFSQRQCTCAVPHRTIQGSDQGQRLSTFAQRYPETMCNVLVQAVQMTI